MQPNQHANLLSIFAWIMAGLQLLFGLLFGIYVLGMGGVAVGMALDPKVKDPGAPVMLGVMALIFGIITLFGIVGAVSNFLLGRRLRAERPPTQRYVIIACVINFLSVFTGGIFAMALGGYGMWFALSDQGKAYFAGNGHASRPGGYDSNPVSAGYARDPNRVDWR